MLLRLTVVCVLLGLGTTQMCEDVDSAICQDLYGVDPNMCDKPCYSATLCRRFCGKCPLKCYTCHEVSSPDQCSTVTQCPSTDHFCIFSQTFTDDFRDVYKLGCALNTVCAAHFGPGLGRREGIHSKRGQFQGSCCTTDLCNVDNRAVSTAPPVMTAVPVLTTVPVVTTVQPMSGQQTTVMAVTTVQPDIVTTDQEMTTVHQNSAQVTTVVVPKQARDFVPDTVSSAPEGTSGLCHDVDAGICSRLIATVPNMCSVHCVANDICPRTCGTCMGCYQCSHVTNPEDCVHKTVCAIGQRCFSVETMSINFEHAFKLGCMDDRLCSEFGLAAPSIFGKRQGFELSVHGGCCKGEFCNDHRLLPTSHRPPTTTTMVPPTTIRKGCHHTHHTCPTGWYHRHHSCYGIGVTPMSWTNAKAQCEHHCAHLVDFSSVSDLYNVTLDVAKNLLSPLTGFNSVTVWTDGKYAHSNWQWNDSGDDVDSSLQYQNHHYRGTFCGSVHVSPVVHSKSLHHSQCSSTYLPLCEISHV